MKLDLDKKIELTRKDIIFYFLLVFGFGCGFGLFARLFAEIFFWIVIAYLCYRILASIITKKGIK